MIPGNIASENRHGADAEAQGEEGLSHGGVYHLKPSVFLNLSEVGNQIEADALSGAWQGNAADAQQNQDEKQRNHHNLGNSFHTFLQTHDADPEADHNHHDHPEQHGTGLGQHAVKDAAYFIGCKACEFSPEHFYDIGEHPAGNRCVEHHEQVVARHGRIGKQVPSGVFRFQNVEASRCRSAAGTAYGKFHDHDGKPKNNKRNQIDDHEGRASVFSRDIGKAPYISKSDGAAG